MEKLTSRKCCPEAPEQLQCSGRERDLRRNKELRQEAGRRNIFTLHNALYVLNPANEELFKDEQVVLRKLDSAVAVKLRESTAGTQSPPV